MKKKMTMANWNGKDFFQPITQSPALQIIIATTSCGYPVTILSVTVTIQRIDTKDLTFSSLHFSGDE